MAPAVIAPVSKEAAQAMANIPRASEEQEEDLRVYSYGYAVIIIAIIIVIIVINIVVIVSIIVVVAIVILILIIAVILCTTTIFGILIFSIFILSILIAYYSSILTSKPRGARALCQSSPLAQAVSPAVKETAVASVTQPLRV